MFILSVDGLLPKEARHFLKHMVTALSFKWDKAYSSYLRPPLAFAVVQAMSLCLRGSSTKWRRMLGFDDGPQVNILVILITQVFKLYV